jgi:hypothetical protein
MGLIEASSPTIGYRLIDPCSRCGREEGVFSTPWPGASRYEFTLLCHRCLWRGFNAMPKGPARRALVRKVFGRRTPAGTIDRSPHPNRHPH